MNFGGELAGLLTSFCWSSNSVLFTLAGRRIGSTAVNIGRLAMATLLTAILHVIFFQNLFPAGIGLDRCAWLAVSGIIGYAVADALLFEAFLLIGPRLTMLLATLTPIFAALLAWVFLSESLGLLKIAAIVLTLAGTAWVVAERTPVEITRPARNWRGIGYGIAGALGQAVGLLCSKYGMGSDLHPFSANLIRLVAGTIVLGSLIAAQGRLRGLGRRFLDWPATGQIAAGAVTGPVIGVTLSLYAILHAEMGIAATLMSLSPVILLPVGRIFFQERISARAIAGTLVAVAGVAMMFLI